VIGQEGIIHTAEYPDAAGLDIYKFPLKLTEKMKPEARVFVFYVHPRDGVIIYDELTLTLGFSIGNSVSCYEKLKNFVVKIKILFGILCGKNLGVFQVENWNFYKWLI